MRSVYRVVVGGTSRSERMSREAIIGLLSIAVVAAVFGLSRCTSQQPAALDTPTQSPLAAPTQPDARGYAYRVSHERYVIRGATGTEPIEVQTRVRESWTAPDGWTWARQTGTDPAYFIFAPATDWERVRATKPDAVELDRKLRSSIRASEQSGGLAPATPAELDNLVRQQVDDLMVSENQPYGALPEDHRRALVGVLAKLPGATTAENVTDSQGRTATRITFRNEQARPGMTESWFFNRHPDYLASTFTVTDSGERGERFIDQRRTVASIPNEVLAVLGDQRADKQIWKCEDRTNQ